MSADDPTSNKGDDAREPQDDNDLDSAAETAVSAIRGFGAALGGWARRVGKVITEAAAPDVGSEELRASLAEITNLRLSGRFSSARELSPKAWTSPISGMAKLPLPSTSNSPDRSSCRKTLIRRRSPAASVYSGVSS